LNVFHPLSYEGSIGACSLAVYYDPILPQVHAQTWIKLPMSSNERRQSGSFTTVREQFHQRATPFLNFSQLDKHPRNCSNLRTLSALCRGHTHCLLRCSEELLRIIVYWSRVDEVRKVRSGGRYLSCLVPTPFRPWSWMPSTLHLRRFDGWHRSVFYGGSFRSTVHRRTS